MRKILNVICVCLALVLAEGCNTVSRLTLDSVEDCQDNLVISTGGDWCKNVDGLWDIAGVGYAWNSCCYVDFVLRNASDSSVSVLGDTVYGRFVEDDGNPVKGLCKLPALQNAKSDGDDEREFLVPSGEILAISFKTFFFQHPLSQNAEHRTFELVLKVRVDGQDGEPRDKIIKLNFLVWMENQKKYDTEYEEMFSKVSEVMGSQQSTLTTNPPPRGAAGSGGSEESDD